MRLLLDTHVLFWSLVDQQQLSKAALEAIERPTSQVFVSIASAWEFAIKVGRGSWPEARNLIADFEDVMRAEAFTLLPITVPHVRLAGLKRACLSP